MSELHLQQPVPAFQWKRSWGTWQFPSDWPHPLCPHLSSHPWSPRRHSPPRRGSVCPWISCSSFKEIMLQINFNTFLWFPRCIVQVIIKVVNWRAPLHELHFPSLFRSSAAAWGQCLPWGQFAGRMEQILTGNDTHRTEPFWKKLWSPYYEYPPIGHVPNVPVVREAAVLVLVGSNVLRQLSDVLGHLSDVCVLVVAIGIGVDGLEGGALRLVRGAPVQRVDLAPVLRNPMPVMWLLLQYTTNCL